MAPVRTVALAVSGLAVVQGGRVAEGAGMEAYEAFRQRFGRAGRAGDDKVSYYERYALFEARRAKVEALNARPGATWTAGLNHLADYTEEERRQLLGYRRVGHVKAEPSSSFLEVRPQRGLAASVDWRPKLPGSGFPKNQGGCGSCWAVSAAGAIETHAEIWTGKSVALSYEQLVGCVKNPAHCGGTGGCKGATAELAFDFVKKHGMLTAKEYKGGYQSGGDSSQCHMDSAWRSAAGITGWERLPTNKVQPLLEAIATKGPVVVSADASHWGEYSSGVFNDCARNATVNHAILMVGYGTDEKLGMDYWLIRNSWSSGWGENGYIRLQRFAADEGKAGYCGTDHDPQAGVGCTGGPATTPVCGMCGCLSDSAYPTGAFVLSGAAGSGSSGGLKSSSGDGSWAGMH